MKGKSNYDIQDVLNSNKEKIFADIWKVRVGKIVSFNVARQEADIELVTIPFREYFDENGALVKEALETVILPRVPLLSMFGSFGSITVPINADDVCTVFFTDRDITNWRISGKSSIPPTKKMHHRNSACFLPVGLQHESGLMPDYNNDAIALKKTAGASVEIDDKVKIENQTQNLKTALDSLADALVGTKVLNPISGLFDLPVDAATISAINIFKTDIGNILK